MSTPALRGTGSSRRGRNAQPTLTQTQIAAVTTGLRAANLTGPATATTTTADQEVVIEPKGAAKRNAGNQVGYRVQNAGVGAGTRLISKETARWLHNAVTALLENEKTKFKKDALIDNLKKAITKPSNAALYRAVFEVLIKHFKPFFFYGTGIENTGHISAALDAAFPAANNQVQSEIFLECLCDLTHMVRKDVIYELMQSTGEYFLKCEKEHPSNNGQKAFEKLLLNFCIQVASEQGVILNYPVLIDRGFPVGADGNPCSNFVTYPETETLFANLANPTRP